MALKKIQLAIFCALILNACGKTPQETTAETMLKTTTGHDATVKKEGDNTKVTINTQDGAVKMHSGKNLNLPNDFPSDVYLPAGITITHIMQSGPITALALTVPGQVEAVFHDMAEQMTGKGWKTRTTNLSEKGAVLIFEKDTRRTAAFITVDRDSGQVSISLQVMTNPPR